MADETGEVIRDLFLFAVETEVRAFLLDVFCDEDCWCRSEQEELRLFQLQAVALTCSHLQFARTKIAEWEADLPTEAQRYLAWIREGV